MTASSDRSQPSAVARLEAALTRIRSPEAEKAFTAVFAESARREAEAADRCAAAGATRGPLDGRIVSVKALFDVAGTVTSSGSAVLRRLPPAVEDAEVVRRLREAGAIIVGKAQTTEFAFSALGTNPHDGTPGNPRDRRRAPGGSSSDGSPCPFAIASAGRSISRFNCLSCCSSRPQISPWTRRPSKKVASTRVFEMRPGSISKRLRSRTTMSADLPISIEPVTWPRPIARAGLRV
ncbi:hypothetical protein V1286_007656 [Bradyrhizobium algeriense]|uniref:Amidase domain-containing protein n=1 Tax=Bradyrhizobium algeriense TaxID=634784 RepID=A0ABU8BNK7_9BRAD